MRSSAWDVGGAVHVCVTACALGPSACEGVTLVDATRTRRGGLLTSFPSMYDAYGTQKPLECAADDYQGRVNCGAAGHMVCCSVLTVPIPGKDELTYCLHTVYAKLWCSCDSGSVEKKHAAYLHVGGIVFGC